MKTMTKLNRTIRRNLNAKNPAVGAFYEEETTNFHAFDKDANIVSTSNKEEAEEIQNVLKKALAETDMSVEEVAKASDAITEDDDVTEVKTAEDPKAEAKAEDTTIETTAEEIKVEAVAANSAPSVPHDANCTCGCNNNAATSAVAKSDALANMLQNTPVIDALSNDNDANKTEEQLRHEAELLGEHVVEEWPPQPRNQYEAAYYTFPGYKTVWNGETDPNGNPIVFPNGVPYANPMTGKASGRWEYIAETQQQEAAPVEPAQATTSEWNADGTKTLSSHNIPIVSKERLNTAKATAWEGKPVEYTENSIDATAYFDNVNKSINSAAQDMAAELRRQEEAAHAEAARYQNMQASMMQFMQQADTRSSNQKFMDALNSNGSDICTMTVEQAEQSMGNASAQPAATAGIIDDGRIYTVKYVSENDANNLRTLSNQFGRVLRPEEFAEYDIHTGTMAHNLQTVISWIQNTGISMYTIYDDQGNVQKSTMESLGGMVA